MWPSLRRSLWRGRDPEADAARATALFREAVRLAASGDVPGAVKRYRDALRLRPEFPEALCNLGLLRQASGASGEAEALLRRAHALAPGDAAIAANLRSLRAAGAPQWQFPMMNDAARNEAYRRAIEKAVRPGDRVLEIGTGSGLLAMMAARCGAARVTTCEMLRPVAEAARTIVERNGFADVVEVIAEPSTRLTAEDLGGAADVLLSEVVASDLIGEGMLDSLADARRLLKPGARVIPQRGSVRGVLAASAELERYFRVGAVEGFDLEPFNELSPAALFPGDFGVDVQPCSEPVDLLEFDFAAGDHLHDGERVVTVAVKRDARCIGVLQWIRLELFDGIALENAPFAGNGVGKGHWKPMLHTFAEPLPLRAGQILRLSIAHNRRNLVIYPHA